MKKINIIVITIILGLAFSCKAQQLTIQQIINNYNTEIIGTWISNDDPLWKITFDSSGVRKDYYENILNDRDISSYSFVTTCGTHTRNNNELFLKYIDTENFVVCDLLNGIHTDTNGVITLSITTERGKLYLFTKE